MISNVELPNGPPGVMFGRGMSIVERGEIRQLGPDWFRVWSQSRDEVWYNVWHDGKYWICECAHNQDWHRVCRHVLDSFIITASESQEGLNGPEGDNLNLPEAW